LATRENPGDAERLVLVLGMYADQPGAGEAAEEFVERLLQIGLGP
jgi:hypothetical protein